MSDRLTELDRFDLEYRNLTEGKRGDFARLVMKLLRDTYVVRKKGDDAGDYFALLTNSALFESFFALIDLGFEIDRAKEVAYLVNMEGRDRLRLGKFDTALVLVLRKLFIKKSREAASSDRLLLPMGEVIAAMKEAAPLGGKERISHYRAALRLLKKHKIVDCPAEVSEESTIEIYPSIALLVPQEDLDAIEERLAAIGKTVEEGEENEETD